jgi:hypothetical protein
MLMDVDINDSDSDASSDSYVLVNSVTLPTPPIEPPAIIPTPPATPPRQDRVIQVNPTKWWDNRSSLGPSTNALVIKDHRHPALPRPVNHAGVSIPSFLASDMEQDDSDDSSYEDTFESTSDEISEDTSEEDELDDDSDSMESMPELQSVSYSSSSSSSFELITPPDFSETREKANTSGSVHTVADREHIISLESTPADLWNLLVKEVLEAVRAPLQESSDPHPLDNIMPYSTVSARTTLAPHINEREEGEISSDSSTESPPLSSNMLSIHNPITAPPEQPWYYPLDGDLLYERISQSDDPWGYHDASTVLLYQLGIDQPQTPQAPPDVPPPPGHPIECEKRQAPILRFHLETDFSGDIDNHPLRDYDNSERPFISPSDIKDADATWADVLEFATEILNAASVFEEEENIIDACWHPHMKSRYPITHYADVEADEKVIISCSPWASRIYILRKCRDVIEMGLWLGTQYFLQPEMKRYIDNECKYSDTVHFLYHHCPFMRYIDPRATPQFQGFHLRCRHFNYYSSHLKRVEAPPLTSKNPLLTSEEDEFLYHLARVCESRGEIRAARAARALREARPITYSDHARKLFHHRYLSTIKHFDHQGTPYPLMWEQGDVPGSMPLTRPARRSHRSSGSSRL